MQTGRWEPVGRKRVINAIICPKKLINLIMITTANFGDPVIMLT